ncbi:hypothetical protein ACWGNE_16125 [Streptomyces xiamenensis]
MPDYRLADCRPIPPAPDDADSADWMRGFCWVWCGWRFTEVLWIGVVSTAGQHAPMYACRSCLERLHHAALDYNEIILDAPIDASGVRVPLYAPRDRPAHPGRLRNQPARHRRPRTALGRRWRRLFSPAQLHPQ